MSFRLHQFFTVMLLGIAVVFPHFVQPALAAGPVTLRYKFTPGEKLRYQITLNPLFEQPSDSLRLTDDALSQQAPIVRLLTVTVKAVQPDGTATLALSQSPILGEATDMGEAHCVVTVTPLGQVISSAPSSSSLSALIFCLPFAPVQGSRIGNLVLFTQTLPPTLGQEKVQTHDGLLVDTVRRIRSDRVLFDVKAGNVLRERQILELNFSLVMTNRGWRVASDFGHVVPVTHLTLSALMERLDAPVP